MNKRTKKQQAYIDHKKSLKDEAHAAADIVLSVDDLGNIMKQIAAAEVRLFGFYTFMRGEQKVFVVSVAK